MNTAPSKTRGKAVNMRVIRYVFNLKERGLYFIDTITFKFIVAICFFYKTLELHIW